MKNEVIFVKFSNDLLQMFVQTARMLLMRRSIHNILDDFYLVLKQNYARNKRFPYKSRLFRHQSTYNRDTRAQKLW